MTLPENRHSTARLGPAHPRHQNHGHRAPGRREGWLAAVVVTTIVLFGAPLAASADDAPVTATASADNAPVTATATPIADTSPEPAVPPEPTATPQPAAPPTTDPAPVAALDPAPIPASAPTAEPATGPTGPPPPTPEPTAQPAAQPTPEPAAQSIPEPTAEPPAEPALEPPADPLPTATPSSTEHPAPEPSDGPIPAPTASPQPSPQPSAKSAAGLSAAAPQPAESTAQAPASSAARAAATRALAAQRAAAQELTMKRAATLTTALARSQTAQASLDRARSDLAATRASQKIAQGRVTLVHRLAVEASTTANASAQSFAALARKLAQQQNGAGVADVFLGGHSLSNMLDQLSTLDQLDRVTVNIETIQARAQADAARADTLNQQDDETRAAASTVSVNASQAKLDAAERELETAGRALVAAASQAETATAGLAAFDLHPLMHSDSGQLSGQGWANPAPGAITDVYGPRPIRPLPGVGAFHYGTDIGTPCGTPVFAATAGIVRAAGSVGSYGNWVLIDHGDGIQTGYAHLATGETRVTVGEYVTAGQQIGGVGSTGLSTGCHTHIEVRVDGVRIDPQPFFRNRGVALGG